jgi:tRNA(Arg) A34 adenosine deaminase TadA
MAAAFAQRIATQVQRLTDQALGEIEREVAAKRRAWVAQNRHRVEARLSSERISPRLAFELLFFDYMGLAEADLPILSETPTEIIWSSRNPCPTLEACQRLRLDTRVVCRRVYEKSTQAFLTMLDPELRFLRDYDEIRPYAPGCRERIVRLDLESMMRLAIAEARQSRQEGNKGYGAVVALGNRVLAQAHDTTARDRDPSLHAEVNAIRLAVRALGDGDLCGAVLVSTCEPCPMCTSLAVWANLTTIVFGASITDTAARGRTRILVPAAAIIARGPTIIDVVPAVLADECLALYS